MKFTKVLLSVCLVVVLGLSSVTVFAASDATIVYGTTDKVIDMDPANAYDFHTWEIFYNIYQGLLKYPAGETELIPGLAESYTISEDGKEYTFKLREGLKFTDGTPFFLRLDKQPKLGQLDRPVIQINPMQIVFDNKLGNLFLVVVRSVVFDLIDIKIIE